MKYHRQNGFTLIEIVIVIIVLGIVAAVAIPKMGLITENSKITASREEMLALKKAIVGDPRVAAGGEYINRGYEGDVGFPPSTLTDLVVKPDSISAYDKFTRIGWNGPYIDSAGQDYLTDAWGSAYIYNSASRTITSVGVTPNIVISF